eukprot:1706759-Rhodomonas_salina.1
MICTSNSSGVGAVRVMVPRIMISLRLPRRQPSPAHCQRAKSSFSRSHLVCVSHHRPGSA